MTQDAPVRLDEVLAGFSDHWAPRTVARFNACDVMVVKAHGEFVWHRHDDTDDFFLVLKGRLEIRMRDQSVTLGPGELFVVPRGVEHQPYAAAETHLLLIEPAGTHLLLIEPAGTLNTDDPLTAAPRRVI